MIWENYVILILAGITPTNSRIGALGPDFRDRSMNIDRDKFGAKISNGNGA